MGRSPKMQPSTSDFLFWVQDLGRKYATLQLGQVIPGQKFRRFWYKSSQTLFIQSLGKCWNWETFSRRSTPTFPTSFSMTSIVSLRPLVMAWPRNDSTLKLFVCKRLPSVDIWTIAPWWERSWMQPQWHPSQRPSANGSVVPGIRWRYLLPC